MPGDLLIAVLASLIAAILLAGDQLFVGDAVIVLGLAAALITARDWRRSS